MMVKMLGWCCETTHRALTEVGVVYLSVAEYGEADVAAKLVAKKVASVASVMDGSKSQAPGSTLKMLY